MFFVLRVFLCDGLCGVVVVVVQYRAVTIVIINPYSFIWGRGGGDSIRHNELRYPQA